MAVLCIIFGFLALLLLLSMLHVHAVLEYQEDLTLTLSLLFFKYRIFPAKTKKVRASDYSRKAIQKRKQKASKNKMRHKPRGIEKNHKLCFLREIMRVFISATAFF